MTTPAPAGRRSDAPPGRGWLLVGWLVSITLLIGVARTAPLTEVAAALRQIDPGWFLAALALNVASLLVRGFRWVSLFSTHRRVAVMPATDVVMIGLGLNAVLPGRVGELVRIGLGARRFGGGLAFNAATVVMERVLDAVTLLGFLGISLLLLPATEPNHSVEVMGYAVGADQLRPVLRGLAVASLVAVLGVVFLTFEINRRFLARIATGIPLIGVRLGPWCDGLLDDVARAFEVTRRPTTLARLLLQSALIWFGMTLANLSVAAGTTWLELSLPEALVLTSISIAVATIPSAPGAWGIFEAGALLSLALLGIAYEPANGLAFVLVLHLAQYLTVVAMGLLAAIRGNVTVATVRAAGEAPDRRPRTHDPRETTDPGN